MIYSLLFLFLSFLFITLICEFFLYHKISWFKEHGTMVRRDASVMEKIFSIIITSCVSSVLVFFIRSFELICKENILTMNLVIKDFVSSIVVVSFIFISWKSKGVCNFLNKRLLINYVLFFLLFIAIDASYMLILK